MLSSCSSSPSIEDGHTSVKSSIGYIINQPGYVEFNECETSLRIHITNDIVQYVLVSTIGDTLFVSSKPSMSNLHRWSMRMDDSCTLWINSSDIGLYRLAISPITNNYELSATKGYSP